MNWGHKITIVLITFVIFMTGLVVICMKTEFSLVEENYYEEEIAYQNKINQLNNGQNWPTAITVNQEKHLLKIYFENAELINQGEIHFFRPSNDALDFSLPIVEHFSLPTEKLTPGKWELQFSWSQNGVIYQKNAVIFIGA